MHRRNIQKRNVGVEPRLRIYVSTLPNLFATIGALAEVVLVAGEHLAQVRVNEFLLRVALLSEHNSGSVLLRGVVDRKAAQISKHLTSDEVLVAGVKRTLGCPNVVLTISRNLHPALLGNGLVPGKP